MEKEKQMFGKQMFAGTGKDSGTQRGILTLLAPPCLQT